MSTVACLSAAAVTVRAENADAASKHGSRTRISHRSLRAHLPLTETDFQNDDSGASDERDGVTRSMPRTTAASAPGQLVDLVPGTQGSDASALSGVVWVIGLLRSVDRLPIVLDERGIHVRFGVIYALFVPYEAVQDLQRVRLHSVDTKRIRITSTAPSSMRRIVF
jgi:hypothetical protein